MKKITAILITLTLITMSLTVFAADHTWDGKEAASASETKVVYGDLTGNGIVELDDAQTALQAALKITRLNETQFVAADVDGEEGVDLSDAQYILKYALRIISVFPVQNTQKPSTPTDSRILVAYFSATNTTEKLAQYLADGLEADLYEIIPETTYTSADLNYSDPSSRTSMESNDPNIRPSISGSAANIEQYDVIFLGYPIWFGQAPKIISTFLESYDFTGKTIVPFCTSASSGIGSSAVNIHNLAGSAKWLDGRRFGGNSSRSELIEWAEGLDLDINAKPSAPAPTPSQNTEESESPEETAATVLPSPSVHPEGSISPNTSSIPSQPAQTQTPLPTNPSTQPDDEKEVSENMLNIQIGEHLLTASLEQNSSTEALIQMLSDGPVTIHMQDYANMEKVGTLPESLPRNDKQINTNAGDLILYQGNSFVIYYDTNSWSLTKLGKINNITQQELKDILGEGNVTVILSLPSDL